MPIFTSIGKTDCSGRREELREVLTAWIFRRHRHQKIAAGKIAAEIDKAVFQRRYKQTAHHRFWQAGWLRHPGPPLPEAIT